MTKTYNLWLINFGMLTQLVGIIFSTRLLVSLVTGSGNTTCRDTFFIQYNEAAAGCIVTHTGLIVISIHYAFDILFGSALIVYLFMIVLVIGSEREPERNSPSVGLTFCLAFVVYNWMHAILVIPMLLMFAGEDLEQLEHCALVFLLIQLLPRTWR